MLAIVGYLIVAAVLLGLVGVLFRPQWALVLVVVLFPLKQLMGTYLPIFLRVSPLFNFLVLAVVLVAVAARFMRRERPMSGMVNSMMFVTLALYGYATLSLLWTPGNGVDRWLDGYAYWILQVMLLPLVLLNMEDFRKALIPMMIVGTITAILFFLNPNVSWYTGRLTVYISGKNEAMQNRGNALTVGQMGGLIAIAAAMMMPLRASLLISGLRLATIISGLGLAVASGSRAQAAFVVITMVLFYPLSRPVKNLRQFALTVAGTGTLIVLIAIGFKLALGYGASQAQRWDISTWGTQIMERMGDSMILLRAYADSPGSWLQGLGANAFSYVSGWGGICYAHDAPSEMLGELGLIGITMYIVAVVLALKFGRVLFRAHAENPAERGAVAALLAMAFYLFILSQKQYTFVAVPEPWWVWVIMAKIATREKREAAANAAYADPGDHDLETVHPEHPEAAPAVAY